VVVKLQENIFNGIDLYYKTLSVLGYRQQKDIDTLLVLSFLEEMLSGYFSQFITDTDFKTITKAITCLHGNCLMPYPIVENNVTFEKITDNTTLRINEDSSFKITSY
jgi:hypothetical protein